MSVENPHKEYDFQKQEVIINERKKLISKIVEWVESANNETYSAERLLFEGQHPLIADTDELVTNLFDCLTGKKEDCGPNNEDISEKEHLSNTEEIPSIINQLREDREKQFWQYDAGGSRKLSLGIFTKIIVSNKSQGDPMGELARIYNRIQYIYKKWYGKQNNDRPTNLVLSKISLQEDEVDSFLDYLLQENKHSNYKFRESLEFQKRKRTKEVKDVVKPKSEDKPDTNDNELSEIESGIAMSYKPVARQVSPTGRKVGNQPIQKQLDDAIYGGRWTDEDKRDSNDPVKPGVSNTKSIFRDPPPLPSLNKKYERKPRRKKGKKGAKPRSTVEGD